MCVDITLYIYIYDRVDPVTSYFSSPGRVDHLQEALLAADDAPHGPVVLHARHAEVQLFAGCLDTRATAIRVQEDVYIHIHTYIHIYKYIYIYVYISICIYRYTYLHE